MSDVINDLVPMLKEYLDISNADRVYTKALIEKLEKTTEAMRECSVAMKLQLKTLEVQSDNALKTFEYQKSDCKARHDEIENKMDQIPSREMMVKRDNELAGVKKKLDDLMPKLYTAMAICTGAGGIVGLALAFSFKKVFGG